MPTSNQESNKSEERFDAQWHYRPADPIATSPLFRWPPKPQQVLRWFGARWIALGENLIIACLAALTWRLLHKPLDASTTLGFSEFAGMFLRNAILISIVAGGLHLWLHVFKRQGQQRRFDARALVSRGRVFTFNRQVFDNMFWTLGSGVLVWTAFEALMFWAMAKGYAPMLEFREHPVWFFALFLLTPVWISFHFYWAHRALHWAPLYRIAHSLHHRNTNIGPWSGMSMHPIEHLIWLSSVLIHLVVAAHPIHILFHLQHQALTAATSHAGFESLLHKQRDALALGNFHHQMHHRYVECNYGNLEVPWDKLFGSFHDGTPASHRTFLQRKRSARTRRL